MVAVETLHQLYIDSRESTFQSGYISQTLQGFIRKRDYTGLSILCKDGDLSLIHISTILPSTVTAGERVEAGDVVVSVRP